jgi:hypothetical protein
MTLIDLAADGTPVDLEFAYTLSAQAKLVLTAHEVYLPKPKLAVEGAACRRASTFAAPRMTPPIGCSRSRSPTTSTGQSTHDAPLSPQACPQFGGCSPMIDLA